VLGFSQLLQNDSEIGTESRKKLATINRSGQHLLALINDVLEISRIEAGRSVAAPEAFDLFDLLNSIEEMIRVRADAKGLRFLVEHGADLPAFAKGDGPHLKQVLINLLGNAVKYTEQGSVSLQVSRGNGDILFVVADTGPGIAADEQERIFQPFYQTEAGIAKGDGTGLGLAISREYTRMMGGRLTVASRPGEGCIFSLSLALPETASTLAKASSGRVVGLAEGQDELRILVVDDKADNRELVRQLLEMAGFIVHTADNGQQAIDVFQHWQPHFIWMDMRMPVLDGYAATRQIRALPGGDTVRIVALTANAFEEDRREIMAAGCDDLVRKPLEEGRLFAVMGELLGLRYRHTEDATSAQPASEQDLSVLPAAVRQQLKIAAEALDLETMQQLVTQLHAAHPDLAAALEVLLQGYRFDRIGQLCDATEIKLET
jgi:CheY-like chemotaxis protein